MIADSKSIAQIRAKATQFIAQKNKSQQVQTEAPVTKTPTNSNNIICKYCNGTQDKKTNKFIHEKTCHLLTAQQKQVEVPK